MLLSSGIHSFPFKLGLPLGLPSTFLGKHGWVQYFCKAAMREDSGLTHKNQQVFIIMNPIDLNLEPPILAVSAPTHTCTRYLTIFQEGASIDVIRGRGGKGGSRNWTMSGWEGEGSLVKGSALFNLTVRAP